MTPVSRSAAATMNSAATVSMPALAIACERFFRLEDAKRGQKHHRSDEEHVGRQISHQADQEHDQNHQGCTHLERQARAHERTAPGNQASARAARRASPAGRRGSSQHLKSDSPRARAPDASAKWDVPGETTGAQRYSSGREQVSANRSSQNRSLVPCHAFAGGSGPEWRPAREGSVARPLRDRSRPGSVIP